MKVRLLILTLLLATLGYSQSENDCDLILSQKMQSNLAFEQNLETLLNNFSKFKDCGLKQIDIDFFTQGPILAMLLVELVSDTDGEVTYQELYNKVLEIKEDPEYQKTINLFSVSKEISERKATIKNWESDKLLFEKLDLPEDELENIRLMVLSNLDPDKTYAQLFSEEQGKNEFPEAKRDFNKNEYKDNYINVGHVNYDDLLKKSIELKKPLLLYFTGYACVNCRKMEQNALYDSRIQEQLKNDFYFVCLYVDDKTKLLEDEQIKSKIHDKPIKYIGQKHSELQMLKFNINTQPYFVIIDNKGNKIKDLGYVRDTESFINFLKLAN